MNRLRTISRALADSALLWVALGALAAVALGSATAPAHPVSSEKGTGGWAATTPLPSQLRFEADRDARLAPDSFGSHAPAVRSGLTFHTQRHFESVGGREPQHRISLPDFGPLYRRPPPSFS